MIFSSLLFLSSFFPFSFLIFVIDFFCVFFSFSASFTCAWFEILFFGFFASCFSPFCAVSSNFPFLRMSVGRLLLFFCFSGPRKRRASEVELDKLDEKSQNVVLKNFKSVEEYEEAVAERNRFCTNEYLERIQEENFHLST